LDNNSIKFINSKQLTVILDSWAKSNENFVPFIHGKAGIGKTAIIDHLSKKHGYKTIMLNLANQEEGDLIGIPKAKDDMMSYFAPEWLHANRDKKCILFLDEIDRAPKNILNFALSIVREYRLHHHIIPSNWKIIAAGNSGINDDFYDTNEMDFALKSRFVHLFYELTTPEWLEWAISENINENIIKYLQIHPAELILEPLQNDVFSYPNPRTWEILSKSLSITPISLWRHIIIGSIGKEIGESFYIFTKSINRKSFPIAFSEFYIDKKSSLLRLKKSEKNSIIDTITNIGNNMDSITNDYEKRKLVEIFSNILGVLIMLKHFELSSLLFNSIESTNNGNKINIEIFNFMKKDKKLNSLLSSHQDKIKQIFKNIN